MATNGRQQFSQQGSKRSAQAHLYREKINIPVNCIGMIIGRGGANIQYIQNTFKVKVDLDKRSGTATIAGKTSQDVKCAYNYIEQQLNKSSEKEKKISEPVLKFERQENIVKKGNEEVSDEVVDLDALIQKHKKAEARRLARLPPLTKDFYKEDCEVANLSAKEAARIRQENNNITVSRVFKGEEKSDNRSDNPIPNPVWKFEHCFADYPDLLEEIRKQKFVKPSPIQSQAWPILLKGEDMIGVAQTGTGKTLAFLLPGMIHTENQSTPRSERGGPNVLVLAPTRELALQIEKEVQKYSFRGMKA